MKFVSWVIHAFGEDNRLYSIADIPDDISRMIDNWISELEGEE